jgi:hypothetical protein
MARDESVTFRLNENIKRLLQELARLEGRTLSNYVEHVLEKHIDDITPAKKQAVMAVLLARAKQPDSNEGQPATFSSLMRQSDFSEVAKHIDELDRHRRAVAEALPEIPAEEFWHSLEKQAAGASKSAREEALEEAYKSYAQHLAQHLSREEASDGAYKSYVQHLAQLAREELRKRELKVSDDQRTSAQPARKKKAKLSLYGAPRRA